MFKKIDHLGIAVSNLEEACKLYEEKLAMSCAGIEEVPDQKVRVAFFPLGESSIELLEPTTDDSPIAKFLAKKGPGIHHTALAVDDIEAAIAQMQAAGMKMIDEKPRSGAHGAKIAFVHPKSTPGMLLELCERK
ncbi:MAG: methylmalonyl-CoA epimerase [Firmicutes bacterium]|nr:methylmalonyl-CoA epimerase [Bacillota bacterium]